MIVFYYTHALYTFAPFLGTLKYLQLVKNVVTDIQRVRIYMPSIRSFFSFPLHRKPFTLSHSDLFPFERKIAASLLFSIRISLELRSNYAEEIFFFFLE